jgi:archaellum biogenesis ATPase FlaH
VGIISRHKPPDAKIERKIITGMIVNTSYLQQVCAIFTSRSLRLGYTQRIASWCVEYHETYKTAPGKYIQDIFHRETKTNFPQDQADEIEDFLAELSEEYEQSDVTNVEYLLKQTEDHFRLNSLDNLRVELNKTIVGNRIEDGESLVSGFKRVTRPSTTGIDPLRDQEAIQNALGERARGNQLMRFPDALGNIVGNIERGYLLAFVGNTGVGKSWWLMQVGWWAITKGLNVLFVSFEMSEQKITTRTYQWATGLVLPRHAGTIYIPVWDCVKNQNNMCEKARRANDVKLLDDKGKIPSPLAASKDYAPCTACKDSSASYDYEPTSWFKEEVREALTASKAIRKSQGIIRARARIGKFKVVQFPAKSTSISDLKTYIQNLEDYNNFQPDVIITDYADKMKSSSTYKDKRHVIDDIWDEHKGLAQERNVLVVTASQGNTVRDGKDLKQGNWAESITKLHLCDAAIRINQRPEEKRAGIYRFGIAKLRDDDFDLTGEVMVLCSLKIGRPYLSSYKMW